ncbi:hypothetical protein NDU88_008871 [Pleurodeles waltl]|uniref:Uncharacterized protein n=1 Tax=Pleurodeles waltl TaxID=8319 RepID=A0AAV7QPV4_PLEWA|nr:hypothetical protein NDU88_008871 [Pleurodeles waltl]
MASSSEVQAPRISAAAPRTTADPPIPGAPRPEPNGAVRATQVGHVASRTPAKFRISIDGSTHIFNDHRDLMRFLDEQEKAEVDITQPKAILKTPKR